MTRPRLAHGQNTTKSEIPPVPLAWLVGKAWKHLRRAANFIIFLLLPLLLSRFEFIARRTIPGSVFVVRAADNGSKLPPREGKVRRGKEGNFHCSQRPIETFIVVDERGHSRMGWFDRLCVSMGLSLFTKGRKRNGCIDEYLSTRLNIVGWFSKLKKKWNGRKEERKRYCSYYIVLFDRKVKEWRSEFEIFFSFFKKYRIVMYLRSGRIRKGKQLFLSLERRFYNHEPLYDSHECQR